jgi:broad specificity phosphatase PhoE
MVTVSAAGRFVNVTKKWLSRRRKLRRGKMHTRLTLVCAGATAATKAAAFPRDEPLETRALAAVVELAKHGGLSGRFLAAPSLAARQTAEILSQEVGEERVLADWNCGRWAGRRLADLEEQEPEAVSEWLSDPEAAPHGGETLADLYGRVAAWLDAQNGRERRIVAVTHAAVIRAAIAGSLGAPLRSFWLLDAAPLSVAELRGDGKRWRIRSFGVPFGTAN